jgi:hypothetical protein
MSERLLVVFLLVAQFFTAEIAFGQSAITVKHEVLSVDMGQPGCAICCI